MDDIPLSVLIGVLIFLILLSAFFSAAEIAIVTLNRYRLRHLAESGHRGARLVAKLLERPDRLIGVILLGSNSVNALFSALTTVTVIRVWGEKESAIGIAALIIALVVLILTDLAPKTLAALHPERIAYPSAFILRPLLKLSYPVVWVISGLANGLLRLIGVKVQARAAEQLSTEEFKTLVLEAGVLIPETHQDMLVAILELEKLAVDDVMVPRGKIEGIDLEADWDEIAAQLGTSRYTRQPVYRGNLDNIAGIVHLRKVMHLMHTGDFTRETFMARMVEPYFIPQGTPLSTALLNFRANKQRMALIVNEYGDILGLVTLEEILEEIVGDFTSPRAAFAEDIQPQPDGSFLVQGNVTLRDLNRRLDWELPITGPKTLNGLIVEYLEDLPEAGTSLMVNGYQVDVVRTRGTSVQLARIRRMPPPAET
ncbi:MAG: HlyC/CorC family transporter [Gammaproteobacteria bacterium]|nr:HlyC/CorC family transporter [Gammaproteobacteria bacterium]